MIEKSKISEIIRIITAGYDPDKIILFGSYATGNATDDSDLDLFVVKDTDVPRPLRAVQIRKMLFGAMIPMDLIVYTPKEIETSKDNIFGFVYNVLHSGTTLYERAT